MLLMPVGIFWPNLLGGGNSLILSLKDTPMNVKVLLVMLMVRFIFL